MTLPGGAACDWPPSRTCAPTPYVFTQTILPLLTGVTPRQIRDAVGLSISYARRILAGRYIPHPIHWTAIRKLARQS